MAKVIQVTGGNDMASNLMRSVPAMAGAAAGGVYGGPAGAAAGGMLGGQVGKGMVKEAQTSGVDQQKSSPVDRRMQSAQSDPLNQLKEGKAALASTDPDTQAALSPVLDEAIKKAAQQKQQQTSGGY